MTQTYLEKHVEALTKRVGVLETIIGKILDDDSIVRKLQIEKPYPTPRKSPPYQASEDTETDPDPLLDDAWKIVSKSSKASTSYLQRAMSLGYNRASKIMDQLEREGIIGPAGGLKPREILKPYPTT